MIDRFWTSDTLNLDDVDVSYITKISREIPESGDLSAPVAIRLSMKFLYAANLCSELIAKVSRVVGHKKTEVKKEGAEASLVRSSETTIKGREIDRDRDAVYIEARNELVDAESLLLFLNNKHDILIAAHYLCRDIVRGDRVGDYSLSIHDDDDEDIDQGFDPQF